MDRKREMIPEQHGALYMRLAPAATFPTGIEGIPEGEHLPGTATVDTPFWIAETQVTYGLWYTVRQWALDKGYRFANAGQEGSHGSTGHPPTSKRNEPVTMISWSDSIVWCNALSSMLQYDPVYTYRGKVIRDANDDTAYDNATNGFRLPTSLEWELAARFIDGSSWTPGNYASGATGPAWLGHCEGDVEATKEVAWYSANSAKEVGLLRPNALGLYDMSGNVWEWCYDKSDSGRVCRGGGWGLDAESLTVGSFGSDNTEAVDELCGFRLVRGSKSRTGSDVLG